MGVEENERYEFESVKEFTELEKEKKKLEYELEKVKKRIATISPAIMDQFADNGIKNLNIHGRTVFIERKIWAKISETKTKEEAIEAIKDAGFGILVSEGYNSHQLSSLLREFDKDGKEFPEQFKGVIEASEVFKLKSRKTS